MINISDLENLRLEKQVELDSQRNKQSRNELGQFATPRSLADDITRQALNYLNPTHQENITFLEPSIGTGSFFSALVSEAKTRIKNAVGIEIDERFSNLAAELWGDHGLSIIQGDFTEINPENDRFNLLLANPPYVRHHHIPQDKKRKLQDAVKDTLGLTNSGLAGLYIYFILLADKWLEEDAVSAWLVPTEWMDVNYGTTLKEYLLKRVQLLRVHKFDSEDEKFKDATVSSSVIFFKKKANSAMTSCIFSTGQSIENAKNIFEVQKTDITASEKWSAYFNVGRKNRRTGSRAAVTLGEIFDIRRGIATGGNKFFVRPHSEFKAMGIPDQFLKPIIPPIKKLNGLRIITGDESGYPVVGERLAIFSTNLPEGVIREKYPKVWEFLSSPEAEEIKQGYLASHRKPWYSQEARLKPDLFVTYMGRSRNGDQPFKFIVNHSDAIATNTFLLMSLKKKLDLQHEETVVEKVANFLNSAESELTKYGRVYGGGLWKLEPKELAQVNLTSVLGDKINTLKQSSLII